MQDTIQDVQEKLTDNEALSRASEKLLEVQTKVVEYAKANPGKVMLGALALGYVVGRIARGRGSR